MIEGIGSQHQLSAALLQLPRAADRFKAQPKSLPHLPLPLLQQRASRRHDQDPVGTAASNKLRHHQACLDRLAQAHTVGEQQPWAAHPQGTHHRHQLVRRDVEPPGLHSQQGRRTERLLQQKGVVKQLPLAQPTRSARVKVSGDWPNRLQGMEQVDLHPLEIPLQTAQPVALLLSRWLSLNHFPGQAASLHLGAREYQGQGQICIALRLGPACGC